MLKSVNFVNRLGLLANARPFFMRGLSMSSSTQSLDGYSRTQMHATTILCIRKDDKVVMIGDGQVSLGSIVVKPNAKKVRRLGENIVAGFAGSAADGMSLLERLEMKLDEHPGQLLRAAVELAKMWRQDKVLRQLQAELLVADATTTLTIAGNGDVLEPHDGVMGIGSGSPYATAAARALIDVPGYDAEAIAKKAMGIASSMCIYTNDNYIVEHIPKPTEAVGQGERGEGQRGEGQKETAREDGLIQKEEQQKEGESEDEKK